MLITEWNDDEYREVIREEAIEDGKAEWLATGIERGRAEGRETGLADGIEQGRAEVARGMKADGEPAEKITRYTGLPAEAIAVL